MVLSISDAIEKYKEYLDRINKFEKALLKAGYSINKSDDFELGAGWEIWIHNLQLAIFEWNVPHYLIFDNKIDDTMSFSIDYVKNLKDWCMFVDDIESSILSR